MFFFLWSCSEKTRVGELSFLFPTGLISSIKHQSQLMCISLSLLCSLRKTVFMDWQDVIAQGTRKTRQSFSCAFLHMCVYVHVCVHLCNYSFLECFAAKSTNQNTTVERPDQDFLPIYTCSHALRATYSNNTLSLSIVASTTHH